MEMTKNTILITGGSSGIGLELATQLLKRGNIVIVTGRYHLKLDEARKKVPGLKTIQSDQSNPSAVRDLYKKVITQYPKLNVLVNNAGIMRKINLQANSDLEDVTQEIEINLNGPIWMTSQFLSHLKRQKSAAIINISSGLAFVPMAISPIYSASKAAIHAYTQSLRAQLKNTNIAVFEVAPPPTETPLFRGDFTDADLSGRKPMSVNTMVKLVILGIEKDTPEIRPGVSNILKAMSRVAPNLIFNQLSKSIDLMIADSKK